MLSLWRGPPPINHQLDWVIPSQTLMLSVLYLIEEELILLEMEVSDREGERERERERERGGGGI